ncbi:hypothetical protein O0I10_003013 [Lichtheimia ornata]|uniref:Amino acid transporter n=1 Tax=Lichtheimia ornata TaxID=688661 RepID=A0AAD7XXY5_9FUNG|nr:uncharacterized protein O0I10_003013 [Lichtheimia ornata]KAJ8661264.1 hypothetical protein O0I10_003013 [Lichtheimia ornata]
MITATEKHDIAEVEKVEHIIGVDSTTNAPPEKDEDAQRLEDLGYKQEFKREISLLVQAGFAFSTMAVLPNWLVGFGGTISSGGPMSLFWGFIVVSPFVMCIALSMSEVFSAYPVNGGIYSWCYLLSTPEWGPLMSWICGYMFVAALLTSTMTVVYTMTEYIIAAYNILNEKQINDIGANIGLFIALMVIGVGYSYLGLKFNGYLNKFMVLWVFASTMIVVIAMPVMAETHPSARWVFTEFQNTTGWQNSGLTFLLGMLQAGWSLIGYENGAHIAEGTLNASKTGPKGVLCSVILAIIQAIVICIATLFSIQDIEELQSSSFPVATLFLRATNPNVAAFLLSIIAISQFGCLCNVIVATGQLMWAMARDGCIPNHQFWYKLHGKRQIPLRIFILVAVISIILVIPILASSVYWSALMSTSVICANVAYGLPCLCRLIWARDIPKGPFNLGSVVLCIPTVNPVSPETMNWSCLMIGVVLLFALAFWYISGRKHYKGPMQTVHDKEAIKETQK